MKRNSFMPSSAWRSIISTAGSSVGLGPACTAMRSARSKASTSVSVARRRPCRIAARIFFSSPASDVARAVAPAIRVARRQRGQGRSTLPSSGPERSRRAPSGYGNASSGDRGFLPSAGTPSRMVSRMRSTVRRSQPVTWHISSSVRPSALLARARANSRMFRVLS